MRGLPQVLLRRVKFIAIMGIKMRRCPIWNVEIWMSITMGLYLLGPLVFVFLEWLGCLIWFFCLLDGIGVQLSWIYCTPCWCIDVVCWFIYKYQVLHLKQPQHRSKCGLREGCCICICKCIWCSNNPLKILKIYPIFCSMSGDQSLWHHHWKWGR